MPRLALPSAPRTVSDIFAGRQRENMTSPQSGRLAKPFRYVGVPTWNSLYSRETVLRTSPRSEAALENE